MSNDINTADDDKVSSEIMNKAKQLISSLESGNLSAARVLINNLNEIRENSLYKELGKLTRELHDTLKHIDVGINQNQMPNAKNRLSYVMQLTEEAANKTMDGIENTLPLSDALSKDAHTLFIEWDRFNRREMTATEFRNLYKAMMSFLSNVETNAATIHNQLQEVLVAQNYQDLTGQAIKKVIDLVSDLESRLVKLVSLAAEASQVATVADAIIDPSQPTSVLNAKKTDTTAMSENVAPKTEVKSVVSGQDEVDDLLSSLGF